jgi:hypothetical protein
MYNYFVLIIAATLPSLRASLTACLFQHRGSESGVGGFRQDDLEAE